MEREKIKDETIIIRLKSHSRGIFEILFRKRGSCVTRALCTDDILQQKVEPVFLFRFPLKGQKGGGGARRRKFASLRKREQEFSYYFSFLRIQKTG
jgi:hypothetical protein